MLYRPVSTDSHFIDEETEAERMGAITCFKIQGIREWYKPHIPGIQAMVYSISQDNVQVLR